MTELGKWEPRGERTHPFDLEFCKDCVVEAPPKFENEADYRRNLVKSGNVVSVGGTLYFVTTTEPPKTERGLKLLEVQARYAR
jgi:hypothetical protein